MFRALLASPVVGAVVLPAGARVFFVSGSDQTAGTTCGTIDHMAVTRTIKTPALTAGTRRPCGYLEAKTKVTPAVGFDLLIDTGLNVLKKIAGGS